MKQILGNAFFIVLILFTACAVPNDKSDMQFKDIENNPIIKDSGLPYNVPDFTEIEPADFKPAYEYAMQVHLKQVDSIANNPAEATVENTLIALEKAGQELGRVERIFGLLTSANTNDELQAIQEEMAPKIAAHYDKITLNDKLFQRIKSLYDNRENLDLDKETARLLEVQYQNFVLAGALLPPEKKEKLKKLNEEEAGLMTQFTNRLLQAAKNAALVIDNKAALKGMSESAIETAAQAAADAGHDGKYLLSIANTTQQPLLQSLDNRDTREKLFKTVWSRATQGDSTDTRELILRLAEIRAEQAELLGYDNYAEWNLVNQMVNTPEEVLNFLQELAPASVAKAKDEASVIQDKINASGDSFELEPWDWNYYAEQVRQEKYALNEDLIKPYFELWNVLENGVFYAAEKLYGITFERRTDIPVYNKDMRVYELFNADGSTIGLFYCDYFARPNKSGGAWMSNIIPQSSLLDLKPVIYNVCNYTKPPEGKPALLSYDDVSTLFHEFGHALHGFFADQKYVTLNGTNVARDFVEFPSQFNEHWALYPEILKHYAVHYKTGEVIPQSLIDKIKKASTFNQGYMLTELLEAASLDMQWHTLSSDEKVTNVEKFSKQALKKTGLYLENVPPRYRSSYFLHIWGNGYAAGYYAYIWTEMLSDDAYEWFKENGGLTRENGDRFRRMILSRGNTMDYAEMYRAFRGHDPEIQPMLESRGLISE